MGLQKPGKVDRNPEDIKVIAAVTKYVTDAGWNKQ